MSSIVKITLGILFLACACGSCTAASCCAPGGNTSTTTDKSKTTDVTLNIDGMTCQGCVAKVEKGLTSLSTVSKATANFKNKNVVVSVKGKVDTKVLIKAVKASGFKASVPDVKKEK